MMKVGDTMDELTKARTTINEIDKQIAKLFEQRLDAVQYVAKYKLENNLEIFDQKREEELLSKNSAYIKKQEYLPYYQQFQKHIMNISKDYQKAYIQENKKEKTL